MSDPVSNADIEDVLSSIRRLVSEEPNGQGARQSPAPEPEVDRFVLTPALRVVEAEEHSNREPAEEAFESTENMAIEVAERLQEGTQEGAVVEGSAPAAEREPQISTAFESEADWSEPKPEMAAQADEVQPEYEPAAPEPVSVDEIVSGVADQSLEQRIAELEAALEMSPQEWEPDGSEDGDSDETRPLSFDAGDSSDDLAEAITHDQPVVPAGDNDDALAGDEALEEMDVLAEVTEALAQQKAAQQPEEQVTLSEAQPAEEWRDVETDEALEIEFPAAPENDSQDDTADVLRGWQESALEDAQSDAPENHDNAPAEPTAAANNSDADETPENFLAEDETMIDEEALREIVADLVRQELQGVLGERITRNVRRLVRREIQRAMAMRDLE